MKRTYAICLLSILTLAVEAQAETPSACLRAGWSSDFKILSVLYLHRGSPPQVEKSIEQCGADEKAWIYKINPKDGKLNLIWQMINPGAVPEVWDIEHDRAFGYTGRHDEGVVVFDLKTGKQAALLLAQTGEGGETPLNVSPDGSRIWARWSEGGNPQDPESGESYIGIFDGKTYKVLQKGPNLLWPESFSEDGTEYYAFDFDAKVWKAVSMKTNQVLRVLRAKGPGGVMRGRIRLRAKPETLYTENLETGETLPGSIPRASFAFSPPTYGQFHLSPDTRHVVVEEFKSVPGHSLSDATGRISIGDFGSGTFTSATLNLPVYTMGDVRYHKGAIIDWCPDSSCFIYNTTQELLTVDCATGKTLKRVPIQYPEGITGPK